MKLLLLSDIHANIHALEAIWARERDSDAVYCAGDLVDWGPHPSEVISWIRSHRVACVRGNHDEGVTGRYRAGRFRRMATEAPLDWADYNASLLNEDEIRFLETLPATLTLEEAGIRYGMTHLYRGYEEPVSLHAFEQFRRKTFGDEASPSRLIFGHTHRQSVRHLSGEHLWINPGSVSYRRPDDPDQSAHYAVLQDGEISLRRADYDARPVYEAVARLRLTPVCSQSAWFFAPEPKAQTGDGFFSDYEAAWRRVEHEWRQPVADAGMKLWRTYSANYLFRQAGLTWAVDPLLPYTLLGRDYPPEPPAPLCDLDVILLTHQHADHWDEELFRRLAAREITWLVPPFLRGPLLACGVPESRIRSLAPDEEWSRGDFSVKAHAGWHWEDEARTSGVECGAWQVRAAGRSWMFFGDIRTYNPGNFPNIKDVNVAFAHVWLGRGEAVNATPPLLDAFCRFHEHFRPGEIVLGHFDERSRDAVNLWTSRHAALLKSRFRSTSPNLPVRAPGLLEPVCWPARIASLS